MTFYPLLILSLVLSYSVASLSNQNPETVAVDEKKNSKSNGSQVLLARTKITDIDHGLNVRACSVFADKVTKAYYSGNYFMYDKSTPIRIKGKVFDTIWKIIEDPKFAGRQKRARGQANYYWANYHERDKKNIALEFHKKSKYAKRLINLMDHLCQ